MAIEAQGLEIQIGARTLLHPTDFHVSKGDKIGLVGRNGAGKTTLTRDHRRDAARRRQGARDR